MKKKILFISYIFPPTGGAGIQRLVKLVKYFHKLGWDIHVLTASNPSVPVYDTSLSDDIPKKVHIHTSFSIELPYKWKSRIWNLIHKEQETTQKPKEENRFSVFKTIINNFSSALKLMINFFILPDPQIGWVPFTVYKAKKIISQNEIPFVFISAPPFSSLLIGEKLKKSLSIKWAADFRDEWTEFLLKNLSVQKRDRYTIKKIKKMEQSIFQTADLITMATESYCLNAKMKYWKHSGKIKKLTNGFDPDDFSDQIIDKSRPLKNKFIITYTGTVFNVTTARHFLRAMSNLVDENPDLERKLTINFVGRITDEEMRVFDSFKYKSNLIRHGYLSHRESINKLYNSDLLLIIIDDLDGSERIIAAKVFEYIYTKIPILALVPGNGEVAKLIRLTDSGIILSNRNEEAIKNAVLDFMAGKYSFSFKSQEIEKFSRNVLAKELEKFLCEI